MKEIINILIIEDDSDDFLLIEDNLKQQDLKASCRCVTTLPDLLEAVKSHAWDVIISDYNLPTLDFEEILSTCQNRLPGVPLILVSGWLGEEKAIELLRRGIKDFILKDNLTRLVPSIEHSLQETENHRLRMAAEAALVESETKYRTLFENAQDGMAVAEIDTGLLVDCNPALCRLVERKKGEIVGQHQSTLHPPQDLIKGFSPTYQKHLQNPSGTALIDSLLSRSGRIIPVEIRGSHLQINGRTYILGIFRDITERKEAEDKLREQEATLRGILNATKESIWLFSTQGHVLMANETALKRYGKANEVVVGRPIEIFPVDLARSRGKRLREAVQSSRPVEFEDKRGEMDFHHTFYPVIDGEGRVTSVVSFSRDITEHKKVEESLKASLDEKVILLKEVHHRVKNNLQIVASLLGLQAGRWKNPEVIEVLQDTRNRVKSMALLHETLYRSENLGHINFADYLKGLCGQLLYSSGPVTGRIRLEYQVVPLNLPLEQAVPCGLIVSELVSNALKHGFPGDRTGRILVGLIPVDEQTILLSIRDEGTGLPSDFKPDTSTGLGLKLVSGLTDQLGGILETETSPGEGTTFRITFLRPLSTINKGAS